MKKITPLIITLTTIAGLLAGCSTPKSCTMGKSKLPATGEPPTITVWATPVASGGTSGTCPGTYAGYATYMPTNTWGWAPDTNSNTVFTAADDGGRADTCVVYNGRLTDKGCAQTTVIIPNPPHSTQYRFCIYFPTNVPTTNYPIILTGFLQ